MGARARAKADTAYARDGEQLLGSRQHSVIATQPLAQGPSHQDVAIEAIAVYRFWHADTPRPMANVTSAATSTARPACTRHRHHYVVFSRTHWAAQHPTERLRLASAHDLAWGTYGGLALVDLYMTEQNPLERTAPNPLKINMLAIAA